MKEENAAQAAGSGEGCLTVMSGPEGVELDWLGEKSWGRGSHRKGGWQVPQREDADPSARAEGRVYGAGFSVFCFKNRRVEAFGASL